MTTRTSEIAARVEKATERSPEEKVARAWMILDGMAEMWFAESGFLKLNWPEPIVRAVKQTYAEGLYAGRCSIVDDKEAQLATANKKIEELENAREIQGAKLILPADELIDRIMHRKHSVTLNGISFDPVTRKVTLRIVGAEVPNSEFVEFDLNFYSHVWSLIPARAALKGGAV